MPAFQHPNSTSVYSNIHTSAPAQLSWQSIFWALVPIALNSMIQPCGSPTPSISPALGFPLRASPIFCACDALLLLSQIAKHARQTGSMQESFNTVARKRFLGSTSRSDAPASKLEKLQEMYIFRAAGFLLGALPQAIKIYACSGLWWTKVWVSMFLMSFLVLESFIILVRYREGIIETAEEPLSRDLDELTLKEADLKVFEYGVLLLSVLPLPSGIPTHVLNFQQNNKHSTDTDPEYSSLLIIFVVVITGAACLVDYIRTKFRAQDRPRLAHVIKCVYGLILVSAGYRLLREFLMLRDGTDLFQNWWLSSLVILALVFVCGPIVWVIRSRRSDSRVSSLSTGGAYFWASLQVCAAVGYYSVHYNPSSTTKPSWTDYLG